MGNDTKYDKVSPNNAAVRENQWEYVGQDTVTLKLRTMGIKK